MTRQRLVHRVRPFVLTGPLLLVAACRQEEPPPPPAAEQRPSAGRPLTAPVPITPSQTPPQMGLPSPSVPPPSPAAAPSPVAEPGVDARDATDAPSYLPRTGEVDGWTKIEPVVVAPAAQLERLVSAEQAGRMRTFAVTRAASGGYRLRLGDQAHSVHVLAIEAATPEDAYGLTTCASSSPLSEALGGLTRVEATAGLRFHTWQGRVSLRASCDCSDAASAAELRRLVQQIVSRIPREDPPAVLAALPTAGAVPGRTWVVRTLAALTPSALHLDPPPDLGQTARLLGLGPDTLMCIASYALAGARRPNTVWVVEYPSTRRAVQASSRLSRYLATAESPAWQSVVALPSKGRYLVGSWTAEEESLQYQLPRVARLLPAD